LPVSRAIELDSTPYHTTEKLRQELRDDPEPAVLRFSRLLDYPSEPTERIERWFTHWLTRLALVADGNTASLSKTRVAPTPGSRTPTSDLVADLSTFEWQWEKCRTHRQRLKVILAVQDRTLRIKYAPKRPDVGSAEWKREVAADERSSRVLATVYGVSHMTIARAKKQGAMLLAA
jgi:hypothetical protein